jgi:hypothetical protein
MQPNADLSNTAIVIETADNGVRCFARPRGQPMTLVIGALVLAFSACMPFMIQSSYSRVLKGRFDETDVISIFLSLLPAGLTVAVLASVIWRLRRQRGVEIIDGTVTLHTPDLPIGRHVFDLKELKGATLGGLTSNGTTLVIERRDARSVLVFSGYQSDDLTPALAAINRMVMDIRFHGFEVIPVAQVAPPREER